MTTPDLLWSVIRAIDTLQELKNLQHLVQMGVSQYDKCMDEKDSQALERLGLLLNLYVEKSSPCLDELTDYVQQCESHARRIVQTDSCRATT